MYFRNVYSRRHKGRLLSKTLFLAYLFLCFPFLSGCTSTVQELEVDHYLKKAQIFSQDFQYREALQYYHKAWKIYEKVENPQIQATFLYNMASLHYDLQEYERALTYYQRSLTSSHSLEKESQIKIFNNIGVIYRYLGRYDDALEHFDKALKIIEHVDTLTIHAVRKEYFIINLNKAVALVKSGNTQKALTILEKLSTSENKERYTYEIALTQTIRGIIEATYFNNVRKALEDYRQALTVFEELDQEYDLAFSYHNIGRLYAQQKNYQKAIRYYKQSLTLSQEISDQEVAWLTYYNLGNTYRDQSDLSRALQNYSASIRMIESIRSRLHIDDFKTSFIEDKIHVYKAIITLLLEMGKETEAFNYLERAKSRALVDLLSNQRIRSREGIDDRLLKDREQRDESIRILLEKLRKEYSKPREKRGEVTRLTREIRQERQRYQELLHKIQAENLEYASFISVSPLNLQGIQNLIPERTAFLEYVILEDKVLIFVVTRDDLHVEEVHVTQKRLQGTVLALRIDIEKEMSGWQEKSRWLYSKLISSAEKYLRDIDTLCIIPYGVLHYLPFGALLHNDKKNDQLLLEQYDLFYAPSSTTLKFAFDKGNKHPLALFKQDNPQNLLLMFANPDQNLAYAEMEAAGIQKLYSQAKVFVASEATKEKMRDLAGNYQLIHFATHGLLDPLQPLFSSLVLADGFLEVHEIFNEIHLDNNSLVTLSACNTALGKRTEGDEILGLTRAFMYAGAPSIIASLWAVDDQSTALLMQRFYEYLRKESKAKSLKQAQISLFHDTEHEVFQHPYYWAAFTLIGDYR